MKSFQSVDELSSALEEEGYIADQGLVTALFLAQKLERPILLEGEPGVGKTEIAKVLAKINDIELIRLQCYEGLDIHQAVYDWNYTKQILSIKVQDANNEKITENQLFSEKYLLSRPLLQAIQGKSQKVLLIDEIDRSDVAFEAFLLELLSDFQITIPEIGTIKADNIPIVVITSNQSREIHDALKRRCLYYWIDHPSFEKENKILVQKFPNVDDEVIRKAVLVMQRIRKMEIRKKPGIAETIEWINGFIKLEEKDITPDFFQMSIGLFMKGQRDQVFVLENLDLIFSDL